MYTQGSNPPAEVEMQKYPPREEAGRPAYTDAKSYQEAPKSMEEEKEDTPYCSNYFLHMVIFVLAFAVYLAVWAIDYFAVGVQASYFYNNAMTVSSYTNSVAYADSTQMFTTNVNGPGSPVGVAMSLIYSWILWKAALIVFAYQSVSKEESQGLRIGTIVTLVLVLLAFDILLTIFALNTYNDIIFFAAFIVFSTVVALVNAKEKGRTLGNLLIPLLIIAFLYFAYAFLLPSLYKAYSKSMSTYGAIFLIIYGYPVLDLLFYSATLALGCKVDHWMKGFFSSLHFLLLGYGVGMVLIVGYTEVEFYYLIAYFIFRNIFVNYIMRGWEKVVANPPALPGWIACYYLSYALSFLPVIGVGKVVVAKSFSSYMFTKAITVLYGTSNPLYPSTTAPTTAVGPNLTLSGNIFWLAAAIIWTAITFTQKFGKWRPSGYDFFYSLFGIYLFYLGITCSLSLPILYTYSTFN
jgi:hypothetical protein